jgi:hypothetical protein
VTAVLFALPYMIGCWTLPAQFAASDSAGEVAPGSAATDSGEPTDELGPVAVDTGLSSPTVWFGDLIVPAEGLAGLCPDLRVVTGSVCVEGTRLRSLADLACIEEIGASLVISGNRHLRSAELRRLRHAKTLTVQANHGLWRLSLPHLRKAVERVVHEVDLDGDIADLQIWGNAPR